MLLQWADLHLRHYPILQSNLNRRDTDPWNANCGEDDVKSVAMCGGLGRQWHGFWRVGRGLYHG